MTAYHRSPVATHVAIRDKRVAKGRLFWPLVASFTFGFAAAWLITLMQSPAEGVIKHTQVAEAASGPAELQWRHYDGKYTSFDYPGDLELKPGGTGLEGVVFYSSTHGGTKQLAVTVDQGTLASNANLNLRRVKSAKYQEKDWPVGAYNWLTFTNLTDGWEMAGFTEQAGKVASVALTDANPHDHQAEFDRILESLRWK